MMYVKSQLERNSYLEEYGWYSMLVFEEGRKNECERQGSSRSKILQNQHGLSEIFNVGLKKFIIND